jgi:predicted TIM-barrel fold metal-dependent hydrolase
MTRIDLHTHIWPDEYRRLLTLSADGAPLPFPGGTQQDLVEVMGRYNIAAAVVSTGPPGAVAEDPGLALELAQASNDGLSQAMRSSGGRLAALASLPLPHLELALEELTRALDDLALDGVSLLTNVGGVYLGDPVWNDLLAELDRRAAYVFVHPVPGNYALPLNWPAWVCEFPFDTTRAVLHLIYSGALERYPRIRFQLAHLGGATPFLAPRIASLAERQPDLTSQAPAGAHEYLRGFYYDTGLSNNAVALASTLAEVPATQVVFGTDWPYAALPAHGMNPAPDLNLEPSIRAQVDALNAIRLVPRFAHLVA